MTRVLKLTRDNDKYLLESSDEKKLEIINKTINGEELYNLFYRDMEVIEKYEIKTELTDSKDKIIYGQIVSLFNKIDNQIEKVMETESK